MPDAEEEGPARVRDRGIWGGEEAEVERGVLCETGKRD
jgi:hypothetical protein